LGVTEIAAWGASRSAIGLVPLFSPRPLLWLKIVCFAFSLVWSYGRRKSLHTWRGKPKKSLQLYGRREHPSIHWKAVESYGYFVVYGVAFPLLWSYRDHPLVRVLLAFLSGGHLRELSQQTGTLL
jgi:hypothetical protein